MKVSFCFSLRAWVSVKLNTVGARQRRERWAKQKDVLSLQDPEEKKEHLLWPHHFKIPFSIHFLCFTVYRHHLCVKLSSSWISFCETPSTYDSFLLQFLLTSSRSDVRLFKIHQLRRVETNDNQNNPSNKQMLLSRTGILLNGRVIWSSVFLPLLHMFKSLLSSEWAIINHHCYPHNAEWCGLASGEQIVLRNLSTSSLYLIHQEWRGGSFCYGTFYAEQWKHAYLCAFVAQNEQGSYMLLSELIVMVKYSFVNVNDCKWLFAQTRVRFLYPLLR